MTKSQFMKKNNLKKEDIYVYKYTMYTDGRFGTIIYTKNKELVNDETKDSFYNKPMSQLWDEADKKMNGGE